MSVIDYDVLKKRQIALSEAANTKFSSDNLPPRAERCVPSCIQVSTCGSLPGTCITLILPDERKVEAAVVNSYKL